MGVNLSRRNRRVAQQLLNRPKVRSGVEKMGRESVSERVSGQTRVLVDAIEKASDSGLNGAQ
jgi:hypothetical protein